MRESKYYVPVRLFRHHRCYITNPTIIHPSKIQLPSTHVISCPLSLILDHDQSCQPSSASSCYIKITTASLPFLSLPPACTCPFWLRSPSQQYSHSLQLPPFLLLLQRCTKHSESPTDEFTFPGPVLHHFFSFRRV